MRAYPILFSSKNLLQFVFLILQVFNSVLELLHKQVAQNLSEEFWTQQKVTCLHEDTDPLHFDLRHFFPLIRLSLMQTDHSYFSLELDPKVCNVKEI